MNTKPEQMNHLELIDEYDRTLVWMVQNAKTATAEEFREYLKKRNKLSRELLNRLYLKKSDPVEQK